MWALETPDPRLRAARFAAPREEICPGVPSGAWAEVRDCHGSSGTLRRAHHLRTSRRKCIRTCRCVPRSNHSATGGHSAHTRRVNPSRPSGTSFTYLPQANCDQIASVRHGYQNGVAASHAVVCWSVKPEQVHRLMKAGCGYPGTSSLTHEPASRAQRSATHSGREPARGTGVRDSSWSTQMVASVRDM